MRNAAEWLVKGCICTNGMACLRLPITCGACEGCRTLMRLEAVPGPGAVPFMLELLMKHGNSGSPRATSELLGPLCLRDNASALCSCFLLVSLRRGTRKSAPHTVQQITEERRAFFIRRRKPTQKGMMACSSHASNGVAVTSLFRYCGLEVRSQPKQSLSCTSNY